VKICSAVAQIFSQAFGVPDVHFGSKLKGPTRGHQAHGIGTSKLLAAPVKWVTHPTTGHELLNVRGHHCGLGPYPNRVRLMLSVRFLAMPLIALTVIVALAQAHSRPETSETATRSVVRAVSCAAPSMNTDLTCTFARNAPASVVR
jgi:hypothetical protein